MEALIIAFGPVPLGWGFIYLVLFLVRWISRPPARVSTLEIRAISRPPSKVKVVRHCGGCADSNRHRDLVYFRGYWPKEGNLSTPGKAGDSNLEAKVNPKDGLKYVWIPPGTFQMGCSPGDTECADDEKPPHQVTITKGFWLGQTEVTVGAYKRFTEAKGRQMPPEPVF